MDQERFALDFIIADGVDEEIAANQQTQLAGVEFRE